MGLKLLKVFFHDNVTVGAIVIRVHSCGNFLKYLIMSHLFVIYSVTVTSMAMALSPSVPMSMSMGVSLSSSMPMSMAMRLLVLFIIRFVAMRMTV